MKMPIRWIKFIRGPESINSKFDDKKGVFQLKEIAIVIEVYKYHREVQFDAK